MPSRTTPVVSKQTPIPSKTPFFTLFSHLPTELRLQIWALSCHPRVVEVRYSEPQDKCLTATPPPPILSVCREARNEALFSVYVLTFGTKSHAPRIYFSPALDVLYLPRWGDLGYADTARDFGTFVMDTTQWVGSLAIDHVKPEVRRPWETYSKFCLMRNFPGLKEVLLVVAGQEEEDGRCGGEIQFVDPRGEPGEVMRLMDRVRESFCCEVGEEWFDGGHGNGECLELVPKCKMGLGLDGERRRGFAVV
ncbi:hypothetical protein QBC34DRAFT_307878 [Podospora aff. communis PSN243]|uniref:2EXR domain-containing protein n=1 Tax=Podospora aff. communis PSN243 TaxID=3040156 RepID=A0AAV9G9V9_9PEZI|nr:hypothetical protein QBC34DRAFT_307878 [Podospora aff. communis PSN243]